MKPRLFAVAATSLSPFLVFACDDIGGQIELNGAAAIAGSAGSKINPFAGGTGGSLIGFAGNNAGGASGALGSAGDAGAGGADAGGAAGDAGAAGSSTAGSAGASGSGTAGNSAAGSDGAGGSSAGGTDGGVIVTGGAGGSSGQGGAGGSGPGPNTNCEQFAANSALRYSCCGFFNAFEQKQEEYTTCAKTVCAGSCPALASISCSQCFVSAVLAKSCSFDFAATDQRKVLQACVTK